MTSQIFTISPRKSWIPFALTLGLRLGLTLFAAIPAMAATPESDLPEASGIASMLRSDGRHPVEAIDSTRMQDHLLDLVEERRSCKEMVFKGTRKIIGYEARGALDSAAGMAAALETYCGLPEPILRYKLLADRRAGGKASEDLETEFLLNRLLDYRARRLWMTLTRPPIDEIAGTYRYYAHPDFDALTRGMATTLSPDGFAERSWNLVLSAYREDWAAFDSALKDPEARSTLSRLARATREHAHDGVRVNMTLFAGAWMPQGELQRVHWHPWAGVRAGAGIGRFNLAGRMGMLFPLGPYRYKTVFEDTLVDAENFGGVSLALEPSIDLFRTLDWKVGVVTGVGGTWATAYTVHSDDPRANARTKALSSWEWSAGVKLDHLWAQGGLWSLEAKYLFLDVGNKGGTPLSGDAVALLAHIGFEGSSTWWAAKKIWD